jgi:hypothetical protein
MEKKIGILSLLSGMLVKPETTVTRALANRTYRVGTALALLLGISALDMVLMLRIGAVEGGNPCLWFVIGGMLDLAFVQGLTGLGKWLFLYPLKIAGDMALIFIPALIAKRRYRPAGSARDWFCVYCYLVFALDVFLCLAMTPAAFLPGNGRALLITNFCSYMIFGANILLFTAAFKAALQLEWEQAIRVWFYLAIVLPCAGIILMFALIP